MIAVALSAAAIAAITLAAVAVARLFGRPSHEDIDPGSVSESWLAQHRGSREDGYSS